jgi:methylated-DNA-[protein]-cysteine S-methyltransferase
MRSSICGRVSEEDEEMYYTTMESPIDELLLASDGRALRRVEMSPFQPPTEWEFDERPFEEAVAQLHSYFMGERHHFDLELEAGGTPFQARIWSALREIGYGETVSYMDVARLVGSPKAARAVGRAVGANPLPIIVPCHRVIGADGTPTGFGGGLERKARLLELEGAEPRREPVLRRIL